MQDSIERSIDIDAPAEKVWALISRPGWWVNDGDVGESRVEEGEDDIDIVVHPEFGRFPIRTEKLDEPRYAAFRWFSTEEDGDSTLTEFRISDRPGGVTLTVVESGFASLSGSDEDRRKQFDGNVEGWEQELAIAKQHVEG